MFTFTPTPLSGAFEIALPIFTDERGGFRKVFNDDLFRDQGIRFELRESYYSFSALSVVRGMHFQLPPFQHSKVVYCPVGRILDVIIDLRRHSASYGTYYAAELSEENAKALYIPEGFAHGFQALTDGAVTAYLVSSGYQRSADTGILWNSFGMVWPLEGKPLISERDRRFLPLSEFNSPF